MNSHRLRIGDVCNTNARNVTKSNLPERILYLDTGNITRNQIDNIQELSIAKDKIPSRAKRLVQDRTVLYSTVRPNQEHYGFLKNPPANMVVSTGFTTLDVMDADIDPLYLYYCLTKSEVTQHLQTIGENSVSSYPSINPCDLECLTFCVPSDVKEQRRIASVLSALDSKIELNNRINAELEQMARTLYDYWFVQFDFPDENGRPYKSSGGKMIYNNTLKRKIPEGWEVTRLSNRLHTILGGTPSTKESSYWKNGDIPWLSSAEIASFPIIKSNDFITQQGIDNSAAEILPLGSVAISLVRHIRVSILGISASASQSVVGICETEHLKQSFIYPLLSNELPRFMSIRIGAQQPHINKGIIDDTEMVIPPPSILDEYYSCVMDTYTRIHNTAKENQKLAEMRDWLLPMLMNGQVSVAR